MSTQDFEIETAEGSSAAMDAIGEPNRASSTIKVWNRISKLPTNLPRTDVLTFELSGLAGLLTALCSILKTPYATLKPGFYRVGPQPFDRSSVVIAVRQIVI